MIIYKIQNTVNGKVYVGQTTQPISKRFSHHRSKLNLQKHCNKHLQSAWNKYGHNNFTFSIVETHDSMEKLNEREEHYIQKFDSIKNGYNLVNGGRNRLLTQEEKDNIREKQKAIWGSDSYKQKMSVAIKRSRTPDFLASLSDRTRNQFETLGHNQRKNWPAVQDPEGNIFTDICDMSNFARTHNLNPINMRRVCQGTRKSHKGWRLA